MEILPLWAYFRKHTFLFWATVLEENFLADCWDKPANKQIPTDSSLVLLSLLGELLCIPIKGRCIPQSLSLMWTLWFTWPWVNFFQRCPLDLPLHIPVKTIYIKPPKMDGVWLVKTTNVVDLLVPHGTTFFEPQPAAMSLAAKEEWSQVPACCDWLQERDTDAEGRGDGDRAVFPNHCPNETWLARKSTICRRFSQSTTIYSGFSIALFDSRRVNLVN